MKGSKATEKMAEDWEFEKFWRHKKDIFTKITKIAMFLLQYNEIINKKLYLCGQKIVVCR